MSNSVLTGRNSLQATAISVPKDNPFKNDLLGREKFVTVFADTLMGIGGPTVFAIDGPWGTGKTTFARMLAQHLKNRQARVVEINAWKTDFSEDPLTVLSAALMQETSGADQNTRRKFKSAATNLVRVMLPASVRIATSGFLSLDSVTEKELGSFFSTLAEEKLNGFQQDVNSMATFRNSLSELAASCNTYPLVVIVDELDRCRPTYAVETLEIIKHLFDVRNVLFVLAVNRSQLDESVRLLYGSPSGQENYFRRFFDFELQLPQGDRMGFVSTLMLEPDSSDLEYPRRYFAVFLSESPFSLRELEQTIRLYKLVWSGMQMTYLRNCWWMAATAILLRLISEDVYGKMARREMNDSAMADEIFDKPWTRHLRGTPEGNLLEASLINVTWASLHQARLESKLLARHQDKKTGAAQIPANGEFSVIRLVETFFESAHSPQNQWRDIIERIETLDV